MATESKSCVRCGIKKKKIELERARDRASDRRLFDLYKFALLTIYPGAAVVDMQLSRALGKKKIRVEE